MVVWLTCFHISYKLITGRRNSTVRLGVIVCVTVRYEVSVAVVIVFAVVVTVSVGAGILRQWHAEEIVSPGYHCTATGTATARFALDPEIVAQSVPSETVLTTEIILVVVVLTVELRVVVPAGAVTGTVS